MSGLPSKANAAEIDRLALALAKEPGSKAFIPLAEEYGKAGMWQEAAAVLEDGLKTYPNFITAMVALGRVYDQLNQPVKAKALLEEAVKISPENLRAHRTLAKIYAGEGAVEAALRSCQVILSMNPQDEEALALRASLGSNPQPGPGVPPMPTASSPVDTAESTVSECTISLAAPKAAAESEPDPVAPAPSPLSASNASPAHGTRKRSAVIHLERWLQAIQSRRRDREPPQRSASSVS